MAAGMATGKVWLKVPSAIKFNLTGKLSKNVWGKDVILHILGLIGVDGALYQVHGIHRPRCRRALSMSDRLCIANMAIEGGVKNGIFPVDHDHPRLISKAAPTASPSFIEADA